MRVSSPFPSARYGGHSTGRVCNAVFMLCVTMAIALCCVYYHGNSTGLRDYNAVLMLCVCYHGNSTGLRDYNAVLMLCVLPWQ